jgi:DNA polymerase IV
MDAFYASVEQRDHPDLRGKPVAVGYDGARGVVATASYEARQYGVHSAMPTSTARRLCPGLLFVAPRFDVYRTVSKQIHTIFAEYTDLIEPVALDEAYLDVTINKKHTSSAWTIAQNIRDKILTQTELTASAGVSYNKFLAKSASSIRKPNGQYLITPEMSEAFLRHLPIVQFHGIGPATAEKMHRLGIWTGADLRTWQRTDLQVAFGKLGTWYYAVAHGEDERPVIAHRERKSVSAETTFLEDVTDKDRITDSIKSLANEVWTWVERSNTYGRTVTVKIKWADFEQATRSSTVKSRIDDLDDFKQTAVALVGSVFPVEKGIRLVGVGLSNFGSVASNTPEQIGLDL